MIICEKINCPYWSGQPSAYGCQRFSHPAACEIRHQGFEGAGEIRMTQYALYCDDSVDPAPAQKILESWLLQDAKYQVDILSQDRGRPVRFPTRRV